MRSISSAGVGVSRSWSISSAMKRVMTLRSVRYSRSTWWIEACCACRSCPSSVARAVTTAFAAIDSCAGA